MTRPLCFVLMPFGRRLDRAGRPVDFDRVYLELIAPAIEQAGLDPLRADDQGTGGTIHEPTFEQLILSEHAVVDLTTASAYVFYQLGRRDAVRKGGTVLTFADGGGGLPFDAAALRALPYALTAEGGPADARAAAAA